MSRKQERKPKARTGTPANTLRTILEHNQIEQNVSSESTGLNAFQDLFAYGATYCAGDALS